MGFDSTGGDKPFFGFPAKSQGRTTPPKQNIPPKNGFQQPQRGWLLTSKTSMKKQSFIFRPSHCLLNILAQKLSRN